MNSQGITISPVDMKERAELGIRAGDTVRVWIKIEEKGKIRLQPFEGLVIATKHGAEPGATFTVRKVASGVGVEKIFPLYSPVIDKIEILKRARVRRSKLYFVREKVAKQLRRILRRTEAVYLATKGAAELEEERKRAEEEEKRRQEEEAARQAAEEAAQKEAEAKEAEATDAQAENTKENATQDAQSEEKSEAADTEQSETNAEEKTKEEPKEEK